MDIRKIIIIGGGDKKETLEMILSNNIDLVINEKGCISVDKFSELVKSIIFWHKSEIAKKGTPLKLPRLRNMDLSLRAYNILWLPRWKLEEKYNNDYETYFRSLTIEGLKKIRNCGPVTTKEIVEAFARYGIFIK